MNIKNKVIKLFGGFTKKDYHRALTESSDVKLSSVYSESRNYYIDDDSLDFEKEQLAYKLGKEMLDNGLIDFSIKEKYDKFGAKIYLIRAKACVNQIEK